MTWEWRASGQTLRAAGNVSSYRGILREWSLTWAKCVYVSPVIYICFCSCSCLHYDIWTRQCGVMGFPCSKGRDDLRLACLAARWWWGWQNVNYLRDGTPDSDSLYVPELEFESGLEPQNKRRKEIINDNTYRIPLPSNTYEMLRSNDWIETKIKHTNWFYLHY